MIVRTENGWIVGYNDDGETEIIRVKLPKDGFTAAEWEKLVKHLKNAVFKANNRD